MDGSEGNNNAANNISRWTCEACGCITNRNQENPTSCSICGSARQLPDIVRRDDPLSAQLLRRSFFVRRGDGLDFQRSFNPRQFDHIANENMMEEDEEGEHSIAALALEVAGVSDAARIPGARTRRDMLMRSIDASPFGLDSISSPGLSHDELLEIATENALLYIPQWELPANLGISRRENSLLLGDGEFANVATLPIGGTEGNSIRTRQPIPRTTNIHDGGPLRRKVIGFRVTFKRPFREPGKSLGGGYLVGITTGSFASFEERNSLQQSCLFWGIDDNGHKYEGSSGDNIPIRGTRRSHLGVEISSRQVSRNEDSVLYGCLETLTVVVDMESRTLSFWRDDDILGTLVRNIPRSGALYPVAVPFNAGAVVAITGIDGSPVACLVRHEGVLKAMNQEKEKACHRELCIQRARLVRGGKPTQLLEVTLRKVFSLYSTRNEREGRIGVISAARLWYRSGLKLKHLSDMIERKSKEENCLYADVSIVFDDFFSVICSILIEDESVFSELFDIEGEGKWESPSRDQFEVGDIVELIEGYEKFGDAARGPMVPGDRGQVVEVQRVASGERHSIRVLYNGRRWWYQPQTLLSEKSGLISTPAVWLVQRILRAHGYDHTSIVPMWGRSVTNSSWLVGDIVFPSVPVPSVDKSLALIEGPIVGRIVPTSALPGSPGLFCGRESGMVCVEFVDDLFGVRVGIVDSEVDERASRVHRVKVDDLLHAGFSQVRDSLEMNEDLDSVDRITDRTVPASLAREIVAVSKLNVQAIDSVAKECEKSEGALARVFASGLSKAVLDALGLAKQIVRNHEDQSNVLPAIAALGNLLTKTARPLFISEGEKGFQGVSEVADDTLPSHDSKGDTHIPSMLSGSQFSSSFGRSQGEGDNQVPTLDLRNQIGSLSRRLRERTGIPPFGEESRPSEWVCLAEEVHGMASSEELGISVIGSSSPLTLYSPELHSVRRGGFEPLFPGEDARRGAPVLTAATKSAICNGVVSNNYTWFHKVIETAKRRKGSTSTSSSLANARDEDGTPLIVLAITLGCSPLFVSYLVRNGATINDDVVKIAALLGLKDILSQLLVEHVYIDGLLDRTTCSQEVIDAIESAAQRQKDQTEALHREGRDFLVTVIRVLIQFGNECRYSLAPETHIYRSLTQILVGRVLLRAMHVNRLKFLPSPTTSRTVPSKLKSSGDAESGRVNLFSDDESVCLEKDCDPSAIAASDGLLFIIPVQTLATLLFSNCKVANDSAFTDYLRLLDGLLWTKEVDDIALGLTLTSILLRAVPMNACAIAVHRFGIADLTALHERESAKRLESFALSKGALTLDFRRERFSSQQVAARGLEVTKLVSAGVVLCPKCHPAELHLTRHSSFRCDMCGNGVDRGFPMHGCRECDWDACEDCIDLREGGIVKWKHVGLIAGECMRLLAEVHKRDPCDMVKAEVSAKDWSLQMMGASIKALDKDALSELSVQISCPGTLTMFEFSNYILPVLHESFCGVLVNEQSSRNAPYVSPKKKPRSQSPQTSNGVVERLEFISNLANTLILQPVSRSLNNSKSHRDFEQSSKQAGINMDESMATKRCKHPKHATRHAPELLRRLHGVLSFFENFPLDILAGTAGTSDDLHSLSKPWAIEVLQFEKPFVVHCEPLMQLSCLQDHLLRSTACSNPRFVAYCQRLAEDRAIIADCNDCQEGITAIRSRKYRLGQIVDFDSETGAHKVKYATKMARDVVFNDIRTVDPNAVNLSELIAFEDIEERIFIGCTDYIVLQRYTNAKRDEYKSIVLSVLKAAEVSESATKFFPAEALPRGTRVERLSKPYTIIGCSQANPDDSLDRNVLEYDVVSDSGEVLRRIPQQQIKYALEQDALLSRARSLRDNVVASVRDRSSRMIALRGLAADDDPIDPSQLQGVSLLRRTWSALALLDELSPVDLDACQSKDDLDNDKPTIECDIGGYLIEILSGSIVEKAPQFHFLFGVDDSQPMVDLGSGDITLVAAFEQLSEIQGTQCDSKALKLDRNVALYFRLDFVHSISGDSHASSPSRISSSKRLVKLAEAKKLLLNSDSEVMPESHGVVRSIQPSLPWTIQAEALTLSCMQLINSIGRFVNESEFSFEVSECSDTGRSHLLDIIDASLESRSLTEKLSKQLGQSLAVVGGALPSWCTELPSLAPRLFSYDSRRQLLERTAFGVSRAAMRLQEAKVNVAPLRQRMAALRGRAVELVGEAFSGGAEDPTALQLQADELYGMEEALGARMHAAFRAQRWFERSLQCAKAAIRRDKLVIDAATVMERYASESMVKKRRLEIRFQGESGFDAASGDEAGVTRGFYADVAEALLSCHHVSSSTCIALCSGWSSMMTQSDWMASTHADISREPPKLPLWIPDLDTSGKQVIPTPRANPHSTPGVYPRPLAHDDPKMKAVKQQFRFIGRVFACAIREGFMFPLPLSCSFLSLVQNFPPSSTESLRLPYTETIIEKPVRSLSGREACSAIPDDASDECSCEENTPTTGTRLSSDVGGAANRRRLVRGPIETLTSHDLPRPGFLGGDVFAIEHHICKELDRIDAMDIREDETEKLYLQVAANRKFAQNAFGKAYECSFEEYVDGKTFVDPLDASQGLQATPLCVNGHERDVTIFNVREWVRLAKQFILRDGVIEQAKAFREGINDFFPAEYLQLFTALELQCDVCGGSDRVDQWTEEDIKNLFKMDGAKGATEALVAVAAIGGEGGATLSRRFSSSSPTIGYLIKTLLKSTPTQRRQFLNFVTSVPISTPGEIEVVPIVSPSGEFLPIRDNCLPRANTCARRLYLPKFESYESFSSVLWAVIREESRFKGFYEWRGSN